MAIGNGRGRVRQLNRQAAREPAPVPDVIRAAVVETAGQARLIGQVERALII
jgi:hypothetical protein